MDACSQHSRNWLKVERETVLGVKAGAAAEWLTAWGRRWRWRRPWGWGRRDPPPPRMVGQGEEEASGQEGAGAAGREGQEAAWGASPGRGRWRQSVTSGGQLDGRREGVRAVVGGGGGQARGPGWLELGDDE